MRSQASFKGHPIHPMLIVYPFAFLTGAFGFGLAGALMRRRNWREVGDTLVPVGIASGLVAAVPGLLDYLGTVPPRSSARTRARTHGLLNSTAMGLFGISWLLARRSRNRTVPLVLQAAGSAAMSVAGYMGGTLVYRNQIGVDHRYAGAGTWREERQDHGALESDDELNVNQMKLVHRNGDRIVVARTETGVAAFADRCTHRGGPLSDGALACGIVQCPWHGSQFDVETGAVTCGPATEPIATYPVK
jgi:nitrite reductase/ring-hydroxylating ferredoxin subunit/uncharacterized membrane protein